MAEIEQNPMQLRRIKVQATREVAYESPDHLVPWGTRRDKSRHKRFNQKLDQLFSEDRPPQALISPPTKRLRFQSEPAALTKFREYACVGLFPRASLISQTLNTACCVYPKKIKIVIGSTSRNENKKCTRLNLSQSRRWD